MYMAFCWRYMMTNTVTSFVIAVVIAWFASIIATMLLVQEWWFDPNHLGLVFNAANTVITFGVLLAAVVGGAAGFSQLFELSKQVGAAGEQVRLTTADLLETRKARDLDAMNIVLSRYIDHRRHARTRNFIDRHLADINRTVLCRPDVFENGYFLHPDETRSKLEAAIASAGDGKVQLEHVLRAATALNHIAALIKRAPHRDELEAEFYPVIVRMWRLLKYVVWLEQQRPNRIPLGDFYGHHFEKLGIKMDCEAYEMQARQHMELLNRRSS